MSMKRGLFQALLGLTAVVFFGLALQADENALPGARPGDGKAQLNKDEIAAKEKQLAEKFEKFQSALLRLKQRLEKSDRKEDRDRAAQLQKVLDRSGDFSITTKFGELIRFLANQKKENVCDLKQLLEESGRLAANLKELLDLLRNTNNPAARKEERLRLEQLVKELERLIRDQKIVPPALRPAPSTPSRWPRTSATSARTRATSARSSTSSTSRTARTTRAARPRRPTRARRARARAPRARPRTPASPPRARRARARTQGRRGQEGRGQGGQQGQGRAEERRQAGPQGRGQGRQGRPQVGGGQGR